MIKNKTAFIYITSMQKSRNSKELQLEKWRFIQACSNSDLIARHQVLFKIFNKLKMSTNSTSIHHTNRGPTSPLKQEKQNI